MRFLIHNASFLIKLIIINSSLLILNYNSVAQNRKDSLLQVLEKSKNNSAKIFLLIEIAKEQTKSDKKIVNPSIKQESIQSLPSRNNVEITTQSSRNKFRKESYSNRISKEKKQKISKIQSKTAAQYLEEALKLSFKLKNKKGKALAYKAIGDLNYQSKNYQLAAENYEKSIPILKEIKDKKNLELAYQYLGLSYDALKKFDKSLSSYESASSISNKKSDSYAFNQRKIGQVKTKLNQPDSAIVNYQRALKVADQNNQEEAAIIRQDLGNAYWQMNDTLNAKANFTPSPKANVSTGDFSDVDPEVVNKSFSNLDSFYKATNDFNSRIKVQEQALAYNSSVGYSGGIKTANLNIGSILLEESKTDEAIDFLEKSFDFDGDLETQGKAYQKLSLAYEQKGDLKKALEKYKNYVLIVDSLKNQAIADAKDSLELLYDLSSSNDKIQILEKDQAFQKSELNRQKLLNYALIAGFLILLISTIFIARSRQAQRKANLLLRLKSLRVQMNPHFIFNSLNSVNNFISQSDERSANKYLANFSRLMRLVMENSNHEFVSLESELKILEIYLQLEHARFKDKFEYNFNIDKNIEIEKIEIPPMLIQPYIENAVWHGLRYKNEKGFLKVTFQLVENQLLCQIEDDGIGRKKSQTIKTKNQKEHQSSGIKNIEERISILNKMHQTYLKITLEDLKPNEEDTGTKVKIFIPHQLVEMV